MHYQTLYLVDDVSLAVYAVATALLALKNGKIKGIGWFACAIGLDVLKTTLQAMKGQVSPALLMLANEVNILAFFAMYLGYRWFVVRAPLRGWVGRALLAATMVLYAALFFAGVPYSFLACIAPVFVLCWMMVRLLLKNPAKSFEAVSRLAAALLCLHMAVILYRTILITSSYGSRTTYAAGSSDPRLLYSMLVVMLLNCGLVMTYVWFCVVEMQGTLTRFAGTDALTGVLNRRALEEEAEREMARCARSGATLAVFAIDIDHFKKVNDTFHHRGGDIALRELVKVMKRELRLVDVVARLGGDEFVVLLPDASLEPALKVAERLRIAVEQSRLSSGGETIEMTVSIGVTQFFPTDVTWQVVLERADSALYNAKKAGRNCVIVDEAVERLPDGQSAL